MSSQNQGRQSPDPERESGSQKDAASDGTVASDSSVTKEESKSQLEGLSSNPKGPLDDEVTKKFSKTVENTKS